MSKWRWWVLGALVATPFLFLIGYGATQLWWSGLFVYAWWPLAGCFALAVFLAWRWQKKGLLFRVDFKAAPHWTERDKEALKIVEQRARAISAVPMEQLTNIHYYVDTAQELAAELARFYHPKTKDPVSSLAILEVLAVIELAASDLALLMEKYLPGSHFLTIRGWQRAQQAVDYYQKAANVGWVIAALFNPLATGARYLGSQFGMVRPWQKFQENLQLWLFTTFINRVGSYLIELYSGRLRRGAARHRELFGKSGLVEGMQESSAVRSVSIVVMGQTKAGKSSLINALLGERRAETDVVEATSEITRYELPAKDKDAASLTLADTVGYAHEGPRQDQIRITEKAARDADILLLALHARNPARQADVDMLRSLDIFFKAHPDLKRPPLLAVVTHIDLLTPSMEWSPPYDWIKPQKLKEKNIAQALAAAQEQMGEQLVGAVPVCAVPGKEFGIQEALLPAITALLEEAKAVGLVRALQAESNKGAVKKSFQQLLTIGTEVLSSWWKHQKQ